MKISFIKKIALVFSILLIFVSSNEVDAIYNISSSISWQNTSYYDVFCRTNDVRTYVHWTVAKFNVPGIGYGEGGRSWANTNQYSRSQAYVSYMVAYGWRTPSNQSYGETLIGYYYM